MIVASLSLWFAILGTPDGEMRAKSKDKHLITFSSKTVCEETIKADTARIEATNPGVKFGKDFILFCIQNDQLEKQAQNDEV